MPRGGASSAVGSANLHHGGAGGHVTHYAIQQHQQLTTYMPTGSPHSEPGEMLGSPVSTSAWPSTFQQIVSPAPSDNILLSPMSNVSGNQVLSSSPLVATKKQTFTLVKNESPKLVSHPPGSFVYTPSSSTDPRRSFSTPVTPTSANRKIIVTPSTSGGSTRHYYGRGGQSASSTAVVVNSNVKTEARRKLNMDNASSLVSGTVDREGFKTPIKSSTKRRADFSSPSPRKSKTPFEFLAVIYDSCLLGCLITGSLA